MTFVAVTAIASEIWCVPPQWREFMREERRHEWLICDSQVEFSPFSRKWNEKSGNEIVKVVSWKEKEENERKEGQWGEGWEDVEKLCI